MADARRGVNKQGNASVGACPRHRVEALNGANLLVRVLYGRERDAILRHGGRKRVDVEMARRIYPNRLDAVGLGVLCRVYECVSFDRTHQDPGLRAAHL